MGGDDAGPLYSCPSGEAGLKGATVIKDTLDVS